MYILYIYELKIKKSRILNCEETTVNTDHPIEGAVKSQGACSWTVKKVCSNQPITDVLGATTLG